MPTFRNPTEGSNSDMESERGGEEATPLNDTVYSRQGSHETKGWDVFRVLPPDEGTSDNSKLLEAILKALKVFAYFFTFACVLFMAVVAKSTFLFMTSQIKPNKTILLCKKGLGIQNADKDKEFYVIISEVERIAWIWVVLLAVTIPEFFSLFRSWRLCIFKSYKTSRVSTFLMVMLMETLHGIGLTMFIFLVLPNMNAVKGIMLTNCVCFVPGVLGLLSRHREEKLWFLKIMLDIVAIVAQVSGFFVWPIVDNGKYSWAIHISIVLISLRWWENYTDKRSSFRFIQYFAKMKADLRHSRYFVYSFVGVWKILIIFGTMFGFLNSSFSDVSMLFSKLFDGFSSHSLKVYEAGRGLRVSNATVAPDFPLPKPLQEDFGINSNPLLPMYFLLIQVSAALLCYVFGKFACKICIQGFSFAFPVCLSVPVTLSVIIAGCGVWQDNICVFKDYLPNYLFWECLDGDFLSQFITRDYAWIWLLWLLSQTWITLHIWTPKCERLASTEKLFLNPMFIGVLIDQSLAMNRRRDDEGELRTDQLDLERDGADEMSHYYDTISIHTEASNSGGAAPHIKSKEHITQIYVCATMWHETPDEMSDMLKSVMRMDEDQSARRNAQKYLRVVDPDYYEFEVHIFFDDAFEISDDNEDENVVNPFVKQLVEVMDTAASHVHQCTIRLKPPKKIPTPYGGRLTWALPGKNKLVAHLKDKSKIRHRKRWSQVMYMYYLLGHRLMELPIDVSRKATMAENTYLLTLDGDIDFQPSAVQLLVDLMKKNRNLGAACGRIHPVGSGPMQWYQLFEYAIGHWLQKATEHMIGCVLCSPGCFSLFRGKALMDDNVMRRYTLRSDEARHYVQYDQGEDRWLCTLLLQRGYRVEYSAASDAYTHCPEGFGEFYNQRRRWVPSTMANIMDLLTDYKKTVKVNDNISVPYIMYQSMLMAGTILGPGTIFLMLLGAMVAAFRISNWISFVSNIVPILVFMFVCFVFKSEIQLMLAQVMSAAYALLMMAVLVGTALQLSEDGIGSPSAIFLIALSGSFFIAAVLHPQEFWCVVPGMLYLLLIPSMYLLLIIYSLINLNVVSWGTREVQTKKTKKEIEEERKEAELNRQKQAKGGLMGFLNVKESLDDEGSISFSFANLFTCIFCTYPKSMVEKNNIVRIGEQLEQINKKVSSLERSMEIREGGGAGGVSRRRSFSKSSVRGADMLSTVGENEEQEDRFDMSDDDTESEKLEPKQERDDLINPYWIEDKSLKRGEVEYLPEQEIRFWKDLIEKYLYPIDQNKEHQARVARDLIELRNKSVFAFFMFNALFILIVFLLQLNKENLHIDWPLGVKANVTIIEDLREIRIEKNPLQLEPIGLVFVFFFALILIIQFVAMLFHRFGTLSHILASIELGCFSSKTDDISDDAFIDRNAIQIARNLQRLRGIDDDGTNSDDDTSTGPGGITRRKTIYKLEKSRKQKNPIGTLDVAFKKRFMSIKDDGADTQTPVLSGMRKATSVRRQTLSKALANRRNTVFADKSKMKTLGVKNDFVPNQHKRDSLTRAQRIGSIENVFSAPNGDKKNYNNSGYAHSSDEEPGSIRMQGYNSGRSRGSASQMSSVAPRGTKM